MILPNSDLPDYSAVERPIMNPVKTKSTCSLRQDKSAETKIKLYFAYTDVL
jgi:hypothetical protein